MKKAISIPNAPSPVGPYSQAVLSGSTLYISGQIPINPQSGLLELSDISLSTKQVMENIGSLLEAANMGFDDIVKCSIFLKNLGDFDKVNNIYSSYFKQIPPARETVQVAKLPLDVNVEISCIAVKELKS